MKFDVEAGGRRRAIEVRPSAGGWAVVVDGRPFLVTLAEAGARWSLLASEDGGPAAGHEVTFEPLHAGAQVVHVDGHLVRVSGFDQPSREARGGRGHTATAQTTVVAPMPGRVVRVLTRPGDLVTARQGVLIIEAMKMENELRAPASGVVRDVRVREGATVERGAVLVVIDAAS